MLTAPCWRTGGPGREGRSPCPGEIDVGRPRRHGGPGIGNPSGVGRVIDHADDAQAAEAARELIDQIEHEILEAGIPIETLETLRFAYATA